MCEIKMIQSKDLFHPKDTLIEIILEKRDAHSIADKNTYDCIRYAGTRSSTNIKSGER